MGHTLEVRASMRSVVLLAFVQAAAAYHLTGNWTLQPAQGVTNSGHEWHAVVGAGGQLFVAGGSDNTMLYYDIVTKKWGKHDAKFPRSQIIATDADMLGGTIFLFGGKNTGTIKEDDNFIYSLDTQQSMDWFPVCGKADQEVIAAHAGDGKPNARDGHSTTHDRGRVWIFGGWNEKQYFNDLWSINPQPAF